MSPLLKDTAVCESLVNGPVREGPLLVISDMCGADRRLHEWWRSWACFSSIQLSPSRSIFSKNGVLRPSYGLTCFPVGVFSVLLLRLGFLSRLLMHLIICAVRLVETDLQFFRGQTVPAHPLGNAVCNTAWTDRSDEKSHSNQKEHIEKTKPDRSCSVHPYVHFLDRFHLSVLLFPLRLTSASLQQGLDGALCGWAPHRSLSWRHQEQSLQHQHVLQLSNTHQPLLQFQRHGFPVWLQLRQTGDISPRRPANVIMWITKMGQISALCCCLENINWEWIWRKAEYNSTRAIFR